MRLRGVCGTEFSVRVENRTIADANATGGDVPQVQTYIYSALLADNVTTLEQSFAFHTESAGTAFAGLSFDITPGSLKWSINLTTADGHSGTGQALTMRYKLSSLGVNVTSSINATSVDVTRQDNTPRTNMTTYLFPLHQQSSSSGALMAKVVVFDVAEVDGEVVPLVGHSVALSNGSSASGGDYVLVLQFPAFSQSLYYDPSLGLSVLLGAGKGGRSSSGGMSSSLFVAVGVAVPVAVVAVVAVALAGTLWQMWRRKKARDIRTAQLMENMHAL
jgi:hypothetical protein